MTTHSIETKIGNITRLRSGAWDVQAYVVREGDPDIYRNRRWYQKALELDASLTVQEVARKHFGTGVLRQYFGGDRTAECPGYSVHRKE